MPKGVPISLQFQCDKNQTEVISYLQQSISNAGGTAQVTATGLQIKRRYTPGWAQFVGVVLLFAFVIPGLLILLFVRESESAAITVSATSTGSSVIMMGQLDPTICSALQHAAIGLQTAKTSD